MVEHGMLSSAGKRVYLTMNTGKWPPSRNWAHALDALSKYVTDRGWAKIIILADIASYSSR